MHRSRNSFPHYGNTGKPARPVRGGTVLRWWKVWQGELNGRIWLLAHWIQYFPRRRSLAGNTSKHVVHHPVSIVSTNSLGKPSARMA